MGLGTCGNRDMWGRDMCPHPNSVGTNGIGTYGVGTYGVGTCGIGTYVLEPKIQNKSEVEFYVQTLNR